MKNTTSFTYDENGALRTTAHDKQYASFEYDPRDLVSKVTNGKSATDPNPKITTYMYTDRGERSREVKGNGNTADYTYFLDGMPNTLVEEKANGTLVSDHVIDYDLNGNRTRDVSRKMNADNHAAYLNTTADYTYDPRDRLARVTKTGDGAGTETYVHDANSNVISQTVKAVTTTFNYGRNRLLTGTTSGVTASYNYDPFGRLDTVTAAGTMIERNVYDGFDHIVENRHNTGTATATTKYAYDPLDRTSTKTTDVGTAKEKTTAFNYLGLSTEVLDEEVAGVVEKSYQYAPWGERLSQTKHNTDGTEEDAFYGYSPHTDVEQLTDDTGNTKATYGYTAYGSNDDTHFTGIDKPDPQDPTKQPYNAYRFNAKRWDQSSGSYDMGFRDYSPGLNRFLSRDSYNGALADMRLGVNPWTGNRYAFAGGNPISGVEIDGHCWSWAQDVCDIASGTADTIGDAAGWVGDQAESAWNWTANTADAAWDWTWEAGSDLLSAAGDVLSDVGDWIAHNADALGDIALDALEMLGGAAATIGGGALILTGAAACAASTPAAVTVVGAPVTVGVCTAGWGTMAAGVALVGIGLTAMVDGGSGLGDDVGRLENPKEGSGNSGTPEPDNPKKRDDRWLKQQGVDPHEVKGEIPGRGGYQDIYVDKNGNIYAVRKGANPNDGEYIGNLEDFQG